MVCPPAKVLQRYSSGRLNPRSSAHVRSHLQVCEPCAQAVGGRPSASSSSSLPIALDDGEATLIHDSGSYPGATAPSPTARAGPVKSADPPTRIRDSGRFRAVSANPPTDGSGVKYSAISMDEISVSARWADTDNSGTSQTSVAPDTAKATMPRGTPLGRYILLDPIGAGGLGLVYGAYDPELDRKVAIKLLRPGAGSIGDGAHSERLLREGQAMARLSHPNVVTVYDVGRIGDEIFVAMELVEGLPLSKWTKTGPHPWKLVRDVFVQAGLGLAAAHRAGLVHRDFKPGNVLVSLDENGEPTRAQVLDFGLARGRLEVGELPPNAEQLTSGEIKLLQSELTQDGMIMGTPQYMAPEQFAGGNVTAAADQFSFCVALWQALYGQRPFSADNLFGLPRVIKEGRIDEPQDRRGVPNWLHRLLKKGLSADPAERHPNMDALLHALQRDRRSRRRQWFGLVTAIVLSAGGATAASVYMRPEATAREQSEVDSLAQQARAAAAKSYFVYPPADDPDGATAYRLVVSLEELEGPAAALGKKRATELRAEFSETLVRLGDEYYEREGGEPFAADYYAAALIFDPEHERAHGRTTLTPGEVATLRRKADDADFTDAELVAAESLAALAEQDKAVRLRRLEALYARATGPSPSTMARIEGLLTEDERETVAKARRPSRSKKPAPSAKAEAAVAEPEVLDEVPDDETAAEEVAGADPARPEPERRDPQAAESLAKQGLAAMRAYDTRNAEQLFHRALSRDRRNVEALGGLAELYFEQGSYQKAVQFGQRAVGRAPRSARFRLLLGDAYYKTLAYQSAQREYEKAKELGHPKAAGRLKQLQSKVGG